MNHDDLPRSKSAVGKIVSRWVLSDQSSGVRVSMLRLDSEGCWSGMLTGSGPRKMVFSTFAETRDMPSMRHMRPASIIVWKTQDSLSLCVPACLSCEKRGVYAYGSEMRDCNYTSHNGRDWQLAPTAPKPGKHRHTGQVPGRLAKEDWITCEFPGEGPHGWAPPIAAKAGVRPGVTDLADRGTDGPTSKHSLEFGVPTLGLPTPAACSPCRGLLRLTTMATTLRLCRR